MAMDLLDTPLPNLLEELLGEEIARRLDTNGRRGVGATVAATTYRGMNALHAAVGGLGRLAVCRYLVDDVGMDVNMWDTSPSKKTPLEHAVSGGNLSAVRFLLDHGADLHQENEQGATVLKLAATKGKCEIVKLLFSRGADVQGKSFVGAPRRCTLLIPFSYLLTLHGMCYIYFTLYLKLVVSM
ncbi:hypothetical protein QYE76_009086 [Lolium multiflorum]|uniref:Uncharacterized protein n=1 Tax=Lolium multiflorum TaxID=4521 RepID=A0AAD8TUJ5_LOLMU|nr:hypothetical protein QYE76_009082 [Lolium multiflorum]KAK1692387.1 hypothetical protein QYE76_009084 [Lolium multiflorum]KAK1692389.1 hypothetical protein QYE76_009086 [Lolium multiflorum]